MKLAVQLGTLSATHIAIAFLFQWYVVIHLGPGVNTDAFFAGMTVPQVVLAVISGSLMHVLVPLLSGENKNRLRHDAWSFFALIGATFGLLAVLLYAAAPWWVPLVVPGFDETGQRLTVELTRIQLMGMVFIAVNGVQWAAYHAQQKFIWAESVPVLTGALALMLLIWALPRFGVIAAAWISTLRVGLQTLLLTPGMGLPVRPDPNSAAMRQAWQRIKPLLLGTAYYKTDPLVDRFFLSMVGSGGLSLYSLAQQIYGGISGCLNKALAAPLVPVLSTLHKAGSKAEFRRACQRRLLQVGILSLGGLLILSLCGRALLDLFIGYGNVSSGNVETLWWTMIWLAGVFVGGSLGHISASSFYAAGDTVTPTRISMLTYTVYLPCKALAFYFAGVMGLAVATSVYYMANLSLQIRLLRRKSFC